MLGLGELLGPSQDHSRTVDGADDSPGDSRRPPRVAPVVGGRGRPEGAPLLDIQLGQVGSLAL